MRFEDIPWGEGACVGTDPEAFFPEGINGWRDDDMVTRVCRGCPIRAVCLEWAIFNDEIGWWGGKYFASRRRLHDDEHVEQVQPGSDGSELLEVRSEAV